MSGAAAQNQPDMALSHQPQAAMALYEVDEKKAMESRKSTTDSLGPVVEFEADLEGEEPTEEDLATLRRVSGRIPWTAFTIAFVELCERFGYYGCQVLCTSPIVSLLRCGSADSDRVRRHKLHPAPASDRKSTRLNSSHWE